MDLEWLRGILDPDVAPSFEGLIPRSVLSSAAHPVYMAETDAYAVTHALMYLTDFGTRAVPALVDLDHVAVTLDACLAWNTLGGNLDLLGELLISAAVTRRPWSPYARLAFQALMRVWDEFEFLPSAALDGKHYRTLEGDAASAYAFLHTYHSTYVGGILCSILLGLPEGGRSIRTGPASADVRPGLLAKCAETIAQARTFCRRSLEMVERPVAQSPDRATRQSIERLAPGDAAALVERTRQRIRAYPAACGRSGAPWVAADAAVEQAQSVTQQDLALVLSDALLIQASRDYNLPILVDALLDRAASALPPSTSLLEATAFLARQQLPSGAIGAHFVIPENLASPKAADVTGALADCLEQILAHLQSPALRPQASLPIGRRAQGVQ